MAFTKASGGGKATLRQEAGGGHLDRALPPDPDKCYNILLDGLFPTGPAAYAPPDRAAARGPGQPRAVASAADLEDIPRQQRELRTPAPKRPGGGGAGGGSLGPPAPPAPAEPPPLPDEASTWDKREKELWLQTEGTFNPSRAVGGNDGRRGRSLPTRGSVSVVVATSEAQQDQHRLLWECFAAQEWEHKELIVVETYNYNPSEYFTRLQWSEKRLIYIGFQRAPRRDFSLGLKRNIGVHLASGEFVAHFDCRDLYAPQYLDCMVGRLCQGKKGSRPIAVVLSRWYTMDPWVGDLGVFNPPEWAKDQGLDERDPAVRKLLFGDAFSFVYRREAALELPFRENDAGAEVDFCTRIIDREGSSMVALLEDTRGVCIHTRRGGPSAQAYEVKMPPAEEADALEAVNCEAFDTYMRVVVEPELSNPEAVKEERRIHPEDGKAYTLTELREICKAEFTPEEVDVYWKTQCKPMLAGGEEAPAPRPLPPKADQQPRRVSVEAAPPKPGDKKDKNKGECKSLLMRLEAAWEEAMAEERERAKNPFRFADPPEQAQSTEAANASAPAAGDAAADAGQDNLPGMDELLAQLDGEEAEAAAPAAPAAAEPAPEAAPRKPESEAPAAATPPPEPAAAAEGAAPPQADVPSMASLLAELDGGDDDEVVDVPAAPPAAAAHAPAPAGGDDAAVPGMAELLAQLDGEAPDVGAEVPDAGGEPAVPGMEELLAQLDGEEGDGPSLGGADDAAPAVPGMEELLAQLDGEEPAAPGADAGSVPGMAELLAQLDRDAGEEVD